MSISPPLDASACRAAKLADKLLSESLMLANSQERTAMKRLSGLVRDPKSKRFSMAMTDQLWRSHSARRGALSLRHLLSNVGRGFGFLDRLLLGLAGFASSILPKLVIRAIQRRMKAEAAEVILSAEPLAFKRYALKRASEGIRTNINQLGEAVLGEEEAELRLQRVIALLRSPNVNYVSVKLSAIFSQINVIAWRSTLDAVKAKLRILYRAAAHQEKFVNLDMEEYSDLEITANAFREVLSEPEFLKFSAGIVVQAYLPDSIRVQQELTQWAVERCSNGGATIKIRIVKGANLAMEQVDAEWHGWNLAPHGSKEDTDAGFKRMLEYGCHPEHTRAVRLGVGSHNLFDIALALTLSREAKVEEALDIEMLEGMATPQARAVLAEAGQLLVYSPIVRDEDYGSALAYLVRRLDENTSPENFLTDIFDLRPDSAPWTNQRNRFFKAWARRHEVNDASNRKELPARPESEFSNEPDTDWTQLSNRESLERALSNWQLLECPPAADEADVRAVLARAAEAQASWAALSFANRAACLTDCGNLLAKQRFQTVVHLNDLASKAIAEADAEVSEAVDFARYYATVGDVPADLEAKPLGTVLITPPWNFPYAIPCGGILAALVAGNAVILKPAPEAIAIGWYLINQLWEAGISRDVLQFVHCEDGEIGKTLITDSRTNAVVLTGSYETASKFREWRPRLPLFAETSGKNAILVSSMADRELAARDLVKSAFGHSGQKCSAASLGILEAEVYQDPIFRRQLKDAASSLRVGPASDLSSMITPLVQELSPDLRRALTQLDEGEEWLVEPKQGPSNARLWSPGVKLGVRPGSWFHQTECFGPVLGLMCARDLEQGLAWQNNVRFGLTAGFHSLDTMEIEWWQERAEAGNLYINRGITGAIVQRQPFGGWKDSNVGPGAKAGGPNYVNLFRSLLDKHSPSLEAAKSDYRDAWENHFAGPDDPSALKCERNTFRYRPRKAVLVRLPKVGAERGEGLARAASEVTGVALTISRASDESVDALIQRLPAEFPEGTVLRTIGIDLEETLVLAAAQAHMKWIDAAFCSVGRIELTRWLDEQVVCETRHRYGNIF